jgi:hypothetical protein
MQSLTRSATSRLRLSDKADSDRQDQIPNIGLSSRLPGRDRPAGIRRARSAEAASWGLSLVEIR